MPAPQIGRLRRLAWLGLMTHLTVLRAENNPMYAVPEHVRDRGVAAVKQHLGGRVPRKRA